MMYSLFISCPRGLEYLLEEEVKSLGLIVSKVNPQGVYGEASLTIIYKICLYSRIANRVQLILFSEKATNQQEIYNACNSFAWQTQFNVDKTFAIEFHGASQQINNTMFGAQVVKDAIVDYFRKETDTRPMVAKENPQIKIHAYLKHDILTISLDLTGYSLHQRGYRTMASQAPIKENIAAALLIRAKWPELLNKQFNLYDPFCGSGTIVIEAALMAANIAPGLIRREKAFVHWLNHDEKLWEEIYNLALNEIKKPDNKIILKGSDVDPKAIEMAKSCAALAGVSSWIDWEVTDFTKYNKNNTTQGLLICNPPYGERLGDINELQSLYQQIGKVFHQYFQEWLAVVLTSESSLAKEIRLKSNKQYTLYNGALECKAYCFELDSSNKLKSPSTYQVSENANMFANRLKKNYQHLQKWAKRNNINCYRVYDADLPEYAYAIDIYNNYAVLQEYKAPDSIPENITRKRSLDVTSITPGILGIPVENIIHKQRKKQKGKLQYTKLAENKNFITVMEGNAKLKVNLFDYLDTGLFLDNRLLRLKFSKLDRGIKFLNCFCYTASASVHAALAGALTVNVDLSNTYLNWAIDNFKLNNINISRHQFIQYDCLEWLKISKDSFDVIFLDPPSFSNSKRMDNVLDIQRDHDVLIKLAMRLLNPNGVLFFSTNLKQFKLSSTITNQFNVQDISKKTIDLDFQRSPKIHQCFLIKHFE